MKLRLFAVTACALAFAGISRAQTYDCRILFSISTTGTTTAPFDNRSNGCDNWTMVYQANNLTGLTLTVQSANGATGPGSFVTFVGSVVSGINPNTSTTGAQTILSGFNSFIRLSATFTDSGGALINGVLYGYHSGFSPVTGGGCPGTVGTPCVVVGENAAGVAPTKPPVLMGGQDGAPGLVRVFQTDALGQPIPANGAVAGADGVTNTPNVPEGAGGVQLWARVLPSIWNGATNDRDFKCPLQAVVQITAATDVVLVAGVSSTNIFVCHISMLGPTSADFTFQQGAGTTCGSNTLPLSGAYGSQLGFALDFTPRAPLHTTIAGRDLCLHVSASVTAGGIIEYAQF